MYNIGTHTCKSEFGPKTTKLNWFCHKPCIQKGDFVSFQKIKIFWYFAVILMKSLHIWGLQLHKRKTISVHLFTVNSSMQSSLQVLVLYSTSTYRTTNWLVLLDTVEPQFNDMPRGC